MGFVRSRPNTKAQIRLTVYIYFTRIFKNAKLQAKWKQTKLFKAEKKL